MDKLPAMRSRTIAAQATRQRTAVVTRSPLRDVLTAVAGTAAYSALLWFAYTWAPYAEIPAWWRHAIPDARVAVLGWFTLLNAGGAIAAAVPVAVALVFTATARRSALGWVIGVVAALYIVAGGVLEFGLPPRVDGWIIAIAQFLAVSLAVAAFVALFRGFPRTISGRNGSRRSWRMGGSDD